MATVKITEAFLKECTKPDKGQVLIYDETLTGFGVRLNPQSLVFFAEKRLAKTTLKRRITIGQYPAYKVHEARKEAEVIIGELAKGIDRKALERAKSVRSKHLLILLEEYLVTRNFKDKTKSRYRYCFNKFLKDWANRPWTEVTSSMVKTRHAAITNAVGAGAANYAMRALSAVINYSMGIYRDENDFPIIPENPVLVLSRTHSWNKLKPRKGYIKETQLRQWWNAIDGLNNPDAKDFFKLLILTGLRRGEALGIRWSQIDWLAKTLTVSDTKNGDLHVLPLTVFILELLQQRKAVAKTQFVFPGSGKNQHLVEIKRSLRQATKSAGIEFTCHDLRRSFATYADNLEINQYGVKKLLNHRSSNDVTFTHYLPFNTERLRKPMDKINNYILQHAEVKKSADVVVFPLPQVSVA